jgi:hypothetical protein
VFIWDDVGFHGWKLSGWSNTNARFSYKNCEKYSRIALGVSWYVRSYRDSGSTMLYIYIKKKAVRILKCGVIVWIKWFAICNGSKASTRKCRTRKPTPTTVSLPHCPHIYILLSSSRHVELSKKMCFLSQTIFLLKRTQDVSHLHQNTK